MLDEHLVAKTGLSAKRKNLVYWKNYRVTVLQDGLFRLEQSARGKFRDEATQAVWYRDLPVQDFCVEKTETQLKIITGRCALVVKEKRGNSYVLWKNGKRVKLNNVGNLGGTCRTLDCCDGQWRWRRAEKTEKVWKRKKFTKVAQRWIFCLKQIPNMKFAWTLLFCRIWTR